MKTIKTKSTDRAYNSYSKGLRSVLPHLNANIQVAAKYIAGMLEINREKALSEFVQLGIPVSTARRFELVAKKKMHEHIFLNGTVAATLAENLNFDEQSKLVKSGYSVVTGGTVESPKFETLKLSQLSSRSARLMIDTKNSRLRNRKEMVDVFFSKKKTGNSAAYTLVDGIVTFHRRKWPVSELRGMVSAL